MCGVGVCGMDEGVFNGLELLDGARCGWLDYCFVLHCITSYSTTMYW